MRKIDSLLQEYDLSHQNPTNKSIHWLCVPAIYFSLVGLLYSIPPGPLREMEFLLSHFANWATPALLLVWIYYLALSPPLALGMMLFTALCLAVASVFTLILPFPLWSFCLGIFVLAWIFQFYGHKMEGKKPSFLKDLQFLLIGPAWLMHFIYKRLGLAY
ncbi:Mpo1 family 2-hydroxy fatty acid dioxygenase [Cyclobacterium salsum]|uniref:Mpo1 family 2-hydroxy fatty acid dioxygenase n=1 Tax=Cyclobacterium salsum TaxID=2666329 RepID=UPI001390DFB2|nr:Mpo1-like protein [Cyclobacterium salsum]